MVFTQYLASTAAIARLDIIIELEKEAPFEEDTRLDTQVREMVCGSGSVSLRNGGKSNGGFTN